jgi:hypothetical protein
MKKLDLTNKRWAFNRISEVRNIRNQNTSLDLQMFVGNIVIVLSYCLLKGSTKICGCLRKERIVNDDTHGLRKNTIIFNMEKKKRTRFKKNAKGYCI